MCGRYLFSDAEAEDIREIIRDVESKVGAGAVKVGEIFPTDRAPVLMGEEQNISPQLLTWGYPGYTGKGVIINARAETAHDKPAFRKSLLTKRCIIPSSGFFEWSHDPDTDGSGQLTLGDFASGQQPRKRSNGTRRKQKYLFRVPGEKVLYMAGLYNVYEGERRFVILTTAANGSVADVHDRMPLILRKDLLRDWLFSGERAMNLLSESPILEKTAV